MQCNFRRVLYLPLVIVAAAVATPVRPVLAQGTDVLDDLVVTVRRKEESLQDVPISVNVLTAEDIERRGIRSLADVTRETPGLILDEGFLPQDIRVVIRGLSPTRGRPNAAILQDGIDISSEAITTAGGSLLVNPRLFDVERIEVVKGPQSALYGRSAFAGAINYVTRRPGDELETRATVDVNDQVAYQGTLGVNGPVIADRLSVGLDVGIWKEEAFFENVITNGDAGGTDGYGVSGSAVFTPSENIEIYGRLEYTEDDFDPQAQATVAADETLPIPSNAIGIIVSPAVPEVLVPQGTYPDSDDLVIRNSENPRTGKDYPGTDREITRFSLIGTFNMPWGDLTSFTQLAHAETQQFQDGQRNGSDFQKASATELNLDQETDVASQELRFSRTDGPFDWTIGALYWKEETDVDEGSLSCFVVAPQNCGDYIAPIGVTEPLNKRKWRRDTEHWSGYAAIDWRITDRWTLGLEGRYSAEDLDIVGPDSPLIIDPFGLLGGPPTSVPPPAANVSATDGDRYFAPKATLEWVAREDLLIYGSVAKGIKPSGISTITGGASGFDPQLLGFDSEEVWVYELGMKSRFADGRLQVNADVFYQDFTDKQVDTQIPLPNGLVGIKPVNAASAEIFGIEADVTWLVTERFTLNLQYTWLDAQYDDFKRNSSGTSDLARAGSCTLVVVDGADLCSLDLSDQDLEDVPEHSFLGIASYTFPLTADIDVFADFQAQYQDSRYDTAFNVFEADDFWLADIRLGMSGDRWELIGYVENVFDDDTTKSGYAAPDFGALNFVLAPPPSTFVLPNQGFFNRVDPRVYGMRLSFSF